MTTLLEVCERYLGYTEGKNNNTIFGEWYGLNFNPWCAMAASKCYADAGMIKQVAPTKKGFASCDAWLKWCAKNNMLIPIEEARFGDIAFFQFDDDKEPDHVGIIKGNSRRLKFVKTFEGNTSSGIAGSQANGDGFYLRKRGYGTIIAIARPKEKNAQTN